jgi:hypothetical protein
LVRGTYAPRAKLNFRILSICIKNDRQHLLHIEHLVSIWFGVKVGKPCESYATNSLLFLSDAELELHKMYRVGRTSPVRTSTSAISSHCCFRRKCASCRYSYSPILRRVHRIPLLMWNRGGTPYNFYSIRSNNRARDKNQATNISCYKYFTETNEQIGRDKFTRPALFHCRS